MFFHLITRTVLVRVPPTLTRGLSVPGSFFGLIPFDTVNEIPYAGPSRATPLSPRRKKTKVQRGQRGHLTILFFLERHPRVLFSRFSSLRFCLVEHHHRQQQLPGLIFIIGLSSLIPSVPPPPIFSELQSLRRLLRRSCDLCLCIACVVLSVVQKVDNHDRPYRFSGRGINTIIINITTGGDSYPRQATQWRQLVHSHHHYHHSYYHHHHHHSRTDHDQKQSH